MGTIVELSPDPANTTSDDLSLFNHDTPRLSLTPLAHGTITSVFSTIVAMSKKNKTNIINIPVAELPEPISTATSDTITSESITATVPDKTT